jgi:hypothetical protein
MNFLKKWFIKRFGPPPEVNFVIEFINQDVIENLKAVERYAYKGIEYNKIAYTFSFKGKKYWIVREPKAGTLSKYWYEFWLGDYMYDTKLLIFEDDFFAKCIFDRVHEPFQRKFKEKEQKKNEKLLKMREDIMKDFE